MNNKLLKLSLVTIVSVTTVATFALLINATPAMHANATDALDGTITWERSATNFSKVDDTHYVTSATSNNGTTAYLYAESGADLSTGNSIGFLSGDEEYAAIKSMGSLVITANASGSELFSFQKATSLTVTTSIASYRTVYAYTSTDGNTWAKAKTIALSNGTGTASLTGTFNYIKITQSRTSGMTDYATGTDIASVSVSYTCVPGGIPETGNSLTGTFVGQSSDGIRATLTFSDGTGSYSYDDYNLTFSYKVDGTSLTLTKTSGDDDADFGSGRLFDEGQTVNSTGVITGDIFDITLYKLFFGSTKKYTVTFTKQ